MFDVESGKKFGTSQRALERSLGLLSSTKAVWTYNKKTRASLAHRNTHARLGDCAIASSTQCLSASQTKKRARDTTYVEFFLDSSSVGTSTVSGMMSAEELMRPKMVPKKESIAEE